MERQSVPFRFDEWADLASADPAAFERRRRFVIDGFLAGSSPRQRRLGIALQREVDAEIAAAGSEAAALLAVAAMLCTQLSFLGESLTIVGAEIEKAVHTTEMER